MHIPPRHRLLTTLVFLTLGALAPAGAQTAPLPLALGAGSVVVEARADGYHLFIRQVPGAQSVLLSEAFELPDHRLATYAFRSVGPNPVNDRERRILNGQDLAQPSLVSSTVVDRSGLGPSFEVVIPRVVEYGYPATPQSRYGKVDVQAVLGTPNQPFWFSIRVFAKPFADYTGAYCDNAFDLRTLLLQSSRVAADSFEPGLAEGFGRLGRTYRSTGIDDALAQIRRALDRPGDSLDAVIAIDTTKSMRKNLAAVKAGLLGPLATVVKRYKSFRIGLVFYRDYMEDYLTRVVAFSPDLALVQHDLDQTVAEGGGDIPEAVVEALDVGLKSFDWRSPNRVLLVLGDAPPHPAPRGEVSEAQVATQAAALGVDRQLILLPQTPE